MPAPSTRTRRRPVRALTQPIRNVAKPSLTSGLLRLATSRPARAAYLVVGTAGLVALAIALIGPKRLERDVFKPLRNAIEPQTDKLWAESRPLREQIAGLFRSAAPSARERLVKNFQSWIGHFHAT
jgi:hypothetical protein